MLNQEEIHRYFNHLSGAKRIEFLYGLLHLCQPLELRYLGTCLEEIARKDYEYLYHAEQKTNHVSSTSSSVSSNNEQTDVLSDEKLDLTDQFTRAHAIVDIGKNDFTPKKKENFGINIYFSSSLGKKSCMCYSIISSFKRQ
jgi:23S rRNA maturation mini-RNase III